MSKQPITRETTVKSKIADLLSQGGFVATETRHNKGQLQLGICITSSKTHIFKIEFEKKQQFSFFIEVYSAETEKLLGNICFSMNESMVTDVNSSSLEMQEWLSDFIENSQYDSHRTEQLIRDFQEADGFLQWKVDTLPRDDSSLTLIQ